MCEFCGDSKCTLTKAQVLEHGPILENNAEILMRDLSDTNAGVTYTYAFAGVPAYYSLSALIPDKVEENPHAYMRYAFDEDTGCDGDWECSEIMYPLKWQTEKEFLKKQDSINK